MERISSESFVDANVNPYGVELDSPLILARTKDLVTTEIPYIDATTNPDIASENGVYSVYEVDACHPASDVARAIEGRVSVEDWEQDSAITQYDASLYEQNSRFFLVVDMSDPDKPKPAVSLRVADCMSGDSSTVNYFKECYGDSIALPPEMSFGDPESRVWDVVGVMAPKSYRNGFASAWAYHALYKRSMELGIDSWIACIADKEYDNLKAVGIDFVPIQGLPKVELSLERSRKGIDFGFYTANVPLQGINVAKTIEGLDAKYGLSVLLRKIASICLKGSFA